MKYKCHCIVHVYDGISTRSQKEILEIEADNEKDAKSKAISTIENNYRKLNHLGLSSVNVISTKEDATRETLKTVL